MTLMLLDQPLVQEALAFLGLGLSGGQCKPVAPPSLREVYRDQEAELELEATEPASVQEPAREQDLLMDMVDETAVQLPNVPAQEVNLLEDFASEEKDSLLI